MSEDISFIHLPQEIIHCILRFANHRSLVACSSVCRYLRYLIESSVEHTYTIELALEGLVDSYTSTVSYAERLEQLRTRRKNWANGNCQKLQNISIPERCRAYELVGGVFAKTNGRNLFAAKLPNRYSEGYVSNVLDLGIPIRDFAIDPSQDLLVLLGNESSPPVSFFEIREVTLKILTISSNKDHPAARCPTLDFTIIPDEIHGNIMRNAFIQIADDILGLFFTNSPLRGRLLLWNWKDGVMILDTSSYDMDTLIPMVYICDFSFLTPRSFMLTSIVGHGCLHLYSFSYPSEEPPVRDAMLDLPPLVEGAEISTLYAHASPVLANVPSGSSFTTSSDSRIHVISLSYYGTANTGFQYTLFVHNSTLMKIIQKSNGRSVFFHWSKWGPKNTRLFPRPVPRHWLRYVHGERVVFTAPGNAYAEIYDFNVARHGQSTTRKIIRAPTIINEDHIFDTRTVDTHLPFHETTFAVDEDHYAFMIDEDRVLGLKSKPFRDGDVTELVVYAF